METAKEAQKTPLLCNSCLAARACIKKAFYQTGGPDKQRAFDGNLISESVFACRENEN